MRELAYILLGFFIVAFGQPGWVSFLGPLAAALGYACFWKGLTRISSGVRRFWTATGWYMLVQAIQLSWMTSIEYQGVYILLVYAGILFWLGLQFGALSFLVPRDGVLTPSRILAMASLWTLIEWGRLYTLLCGFTWNPAGIALASYVPGMQWAAIFGVLGLSFWVMLVNGYALRAFCLGRSVKNYATWGALALFPYLFGVAHIAYHDQIASSQKKADPLAISLVQTSLLPAEKIPIHGRLEEFVSPIEQWRRILNLLTQQGREKFDMIALPEGALPFVSDWVIYPLEHVAEVVSKEIGEDAAPYFPPLQSPYAEKRRIEGQEMWVVSNLFWAQTVANFFSSEIVLGLESQDRLRSGRKSYNAAFHLLPRNFSTSRYEKRVLLPLAEYLPFEWCKALARTYGVSDFFERGLEAKVFKGIVPFSISICYEETFADLVREGRLMGAQLFVNLTNDSWYPYSRLPQQHFDLGRLRAVENGVPVVRACNTGVTAAIDGVGRLLTDIGGKQTLAEGVMGALTVDVAPHVHTTFYTYWGDMGIVLLSTLLLGIFFFRRISLFFLARKSAFD